MRKSLRTSFFRRSFSAKGKDLDHEEGHRDAEDGSDDIAYDIGEMQQIIENHNDDILDEIIRKIGDREFDITLQGKRIVENDAAVHPVSDEIAQDIADVEGEVAVHSMGKDPGQKAAVKGIDAADEQEKQEFPGEEMMFDLCQKWVQRKDSFINVLVVLSPRSGALSRKHDQRKVFWYLF